MLKRLLASLILALFAINANAACCSSFSIFPDSTTQFGSYALIPPTYTDALVLVANTPQTQAVPTPAKWVVFSAACNFFALQGASAAVPGASTTNGSASMQNPSAWNVTGITQITVVAASACIVTLSFYQ